MAKMNSAMSWYPRLTMFLFSFHHYFSAPHRVPPHHGRWSQVDDDFSDAFTSLRVLNDRTAALQQLVYEPHSQCTTNGVSELSAPPPPPHHHQIFASTRFNPAFCCSLSLLGGGWGSSASRRGEELSPALSGGQEHDQVLPIRISRGNDQCASAPRPPPSFFEFLSFIN